MLLITQDQTPELIIEKNLGLVRGNTIRAKHIGRDIMAAFKNLIGGEIKGYTEMLSEAREESIERMVAEAEKKGADAVMAVRFVTSPVMQGAAELLVYGTAVKLKK